MTLTIAHSQTQAHDMVIAAFYHFFDFKDFAAFQPVLLTRMQALGIKGSILITSEGINSTLSGTRAAVDEFMHYLQSDIVFGPIQWKESIAAYQPFGKARVRLKKETISLGEPAPLDRRGIYVKPQDWNDLISQPDVISIDTRNDYEVNLGTFEGAIDPRIGDFKKLPAWVRENQETLKNKKIATFCTGGIRCEKFTAWMKAEGFDEVYHLEGGILQYLEDIPESESLWQGECFVFDERIAVDHRLRPSQTAKLCAWCDHTLTEADQDHPSYKPGRACPHCDGKDDHRHDRPATASDRTPRHGRIRF